MSDNQILARISNLWSGFLSLWITGIETAHPEIAYENAISSMTVKFTKLKRVSAAIIRRRDDLTERYKATTDSLSQVEKDLATAVDTEQDDLSLVLIEKRNLLTEQVKSLQGELQKATTDADDAKASLLSTKAEIDRLKAEKDTELARLESAEAKSRINAQLEGLSVDAEVKALDAVRTHIKNVVAESNLDKELKDADLDTRLKKLRQQSGSISARTELDALKAARAQKQQATVKTL